MIMDMVRVMDIVTDIMATDMVMINLTAMTMLRRPDTTLAMRPIQ
jgi:hypothetical protein